MSDEQPSSGFKLAVGWSAVVLAIIGGITGGMNWTANNIAKPLVSRLIENLDFQESNAAENTKALNGLKESIDTQNKNYVTGVGKTHELQRDQIRAAEKAAEILAAPKKE